MLEALNLGLTKMVVEVVADQEATIAMFRSLGFDPEALLADHVRDQAGEPARPDDSCALGRGVVGVDERVRDRRQRMSTDQNTSFATTPS